MQVLMRECKKLFPLLFCLLCFQKLKAQDTVFVQRYTFDESVNNLDSDGKNLIVRTANHLYLLGNDGFKAIRNIDLSDGRYTWIRSNNSESGFATFNTSYISNEKHASKVDLGNLLPGEFHPNITKASRGKSFFVNYRGSVLEYEVNGFYKIMHKGKSIRSVYNDDSIKITSTYSGVFLDTAYSAYTEAITKGADYANGEISKINRRYYICKDDIMVLESNQWKRVVGNIENPYFLKLRERDGIVYFLERQMVGMIDLVKENIIDTLFNNHGVLHDLKWFGGQWVVAGEDGYLYFLNNNTEPEKIFVGSCIYDINPKGDIAILSCRDGVYRYNLNTKRVEKLFTLTESVQSLFVEDEVLISTFSGLYVIHDQQLYNLVPYVEFNKFALSQWENSVFAGSIEGLYVIDRGQLIHDIIPGLTPYEVDTTTPKSYFYLFFILLLAVFGIFYFINRRHRNKLQVEVIKRTKITPESIRQLMLENEKIISVEAVAEHFATSTVQLNRILKRYNTSGLALLKVIKGEIVLSMIEKHASLDEISNRVGYSIAYIKRNYLRKLG